MKAMRLLALPFLCLLFLLLPSASSLSIRTLDSNYPRGRGLGRHYWPGAFERPNWEAAEVHDPRWDASAQGRGQRGHARQAWDGSGVNREYAPEHTFGMHGRSHGATTRNFGPDRSLVAGWNIPVASPYYYTPPSLAGDWWRVPSPAAGTTFTNRGNSQLPAKASFFLRR